MPMFIRSFAAFNFGSARFVILRLEKYASAMSITEPRKHVYTSRRMMPLPSCQMRADIDAKQFRRCTALSINIGHILAVIATVPILCVFACVTYQKSL